MNKRRRFTFVALFVTATVGLGKAQESPRKMLEARISVFDLRDSTIFDGVARLSAEPTQFAFAFEYILKTRFTDPPIPDVRFTLHLENRTVRDILEALCGYDNRYTWSLDDKTINVYPKSIVGDDSYLMNRRLPNLALRNVVNAESAMFSSVSQLPSPFEQIAFAQAGGTTGYATAWNSTFQNITMRQAMNRIASNLGPHGGWVLSGSNDFRTIGFHNREIHQHTDKGAE